jgi:hypothetical protein
MHVKFEETFEKAAPAGFDGLFDWDFIIPAFAPTKIEPMDIDGVVERKGNFLIFETKHEGKDIPLGQKITLENLLKLGRGKITIFVLYGKDNNSIVGMEEWVYSNRKVIKHTTQCDGNYIYAMTKAWFSKVNNE